MADLTTALRAAVRDALRQPGETDLADVILDGLHERGVVLAERQRIEAFIGFANIIRENGTAMAYPPAKPLRVTLPAGFGEPKCYEADMRAAGRGHLLGDR